MTIDVDCFRIAQSVSLSRVSRHTHTRTHSLPLVQSKAKLGFSLALCFTCSIYVVLGTAFVAIFTSKGKTIYASVNQQWSYFYTNAASRESLTPFERAVTTLLRLVIVLFPALDVMSAYPLMAGESL